MKLSIIVPVYNSERWLNRCVQSIVNQTYRDCEIILVEDYSDDKSLKICTELSRKYSNILLVRSNGKGVSGARNTGLAYASGDIIGFCDADDFFESGAFSRVMGLFTDRKDIDIVVSGFFRMASDLKTKKSFTVKKNKYCQSHKLMSLILNEEYIMGSVWNKFFRAVLLKDIRFDNNLTYCEDMHFVIRVLSEYQDCSCIILNEELYNYVSNEDSLTHDSSRLFDTDGNLKYINAMEAIYRDCELDARLMNAVRSKIVTLAVNTYLGFHLQESDKRNLLNEMDRNFIFFVKNMFEYMNIKHFIKHIKTIIRIILLKHNIKKNKRGDRIEEAL